MPKQAPAPLIVSKTEVVYQGLDIPPLPSPIQYNAEIGKPMILTDRTLAKMWDDFSEGRLGNIGYVCGTFEDNEVMKLHSDEELRWIKQMKVWANEIIRQNENIKLRGKSRPFIE